MQTLEEVRKRISTAQDLYSIVRTMKAIASVNIRQYQEAVALISQYNQAIETGLQIVLQHSPEPIEMPTPEEESKTGLIVFGSDQGLVGQFNQMIVDFTVDKFTTMNLGVSDYFLLAVGARALAQLEKHKMSVDQLLPLPGSLTGVTGLVSEILFHIEDWRDKRKVTRIYLFYNTPTSGANYRQAQTQLIPVDRGWLEGIHQQPWKERSLASFRAVPVQLFTRLLREHFFLSLFRALSESLASENASRLNAMQAAEKNIEDRIDELQQQYHFQRQTAITEELMDVITGFEAQKKRRSKGD